MCQCSVLYRKKKIKQIKTIIKFLETFFCSEEHKHFVLACKSHPFVEVSHRNDKCFCKVQEPRVACSFGGNIKLLINDCAVKVCMKKIPKYF